MVPCVWAICVLLWSGITLALQYRQWYRGTSWQHGDIVPATGTQRYRQMLDIAWHDIKCTQPNYRDYLLTYVDLLDFHLLVDIDLLAFDLLGCSIFCSSSCRHSQPASSFEVVRVGLLVSTFWQSTIWANHMQLYRRTVAYFQCICLVTHLKCVHQMYAPSKVWTHPYMIYIYTVWHYWYITPNDSSIIPYCMEHTIR